MRSVAAILLLLTITPILNSQLYLTAPFGPDGTYNLYEVRGNGDGVLARLNSSPEFSPPFTPVEEVTEVITGNGVSGHIVTVDSALENHFLLEAG